jgi:N-glycosylase/DNA lyase
LKQDPTHLHYRATWPSSPIAIKDDTPSLIDTYFTLPLSLKTLYTHFSTVDPNFALRAPSFAGIRILNQPAWEALVSFICSSNNNISRISQMVSKLCAAYGPYIGSIAGEPFHDFPTPEQLAVDGVEDKLRTLGFGYRAKYIAETAMIVSGSGRGWLDGLRNPTSPALGSSPDIKASSPTPEEKRDPPTYKSAHQALLTLTGVGPKVADCVCLMGLGWSEAVPVDTHVWQIAQRDYKFGLKHKGKTFNKAIHDAVGDHFRGIWGEYAGWAQSVLFTANLKSFSKQAGTKTEDKEAVKVEEVVKIEETVKVEETTEEEKPSTTITTSKRKRGAALVVTDERTVRDALNIKTEDGGEVAEEVTVTSARRSKRTRTRVQ